MRLVQGGFLTIVGRKFSFPRKAHAIGYWRAVFPKVDRTTACSKNRKMLGAESGLEYNVGEGVLSIYSFKGGRSQGLVVGH